MCLLGPYKGIQRGLLIFEGSRRGRGTPHARGESDLWFARPVHRNLVEAGDIERDVASRRHRDCPWDQVVRRIRRQVVKEGQRLIRAAGIRITEPNRAAPSGPSGDNGWDDEAKR